MLCLTGLLMKITEWKDDLLKEYDGEEDRSTIYSFYCMVHVLLGYHSYAVKHLNHIQRELKDKGIKLGRDQTVLYRLEIAGVRTVRFISDLLGPVSDEKNGLRERWHWLAYCRIHNIKSLIGSYKDNRFNCLFETSAQVLFHRKDILNFFSDLQTTNLKVKSGNLDLMDGKIVAIITSLASVYFKISGPYWYAMSSGHCNYLSLHEYVQPMYQKIMLWVKDLLSILNVNDDLLFEDFPYKRKSVMFLTSMQQPSKIKIFLKCTSGICEGMLECCKNQLSAFLSGGMSRPVEKKKEQYREHRCII
ncbi:uncharacterized protein LOC126817166 [Patella vulgata]|uniref:uncharacterized protein LOC126817166 n=1 Tax=Patella vulgata TaxID=6465 RepID=UPI00218004AC|nr:uncharacterized protein LOC126817166 [Patella vulgata]